MTLLSLKKYYDFNMNNDLIVEYEFVETPDADERLTRVFEMLITEKDLYGDDAIEENDE